MSSYSPTMPHSLAFYSSPSRHYYRSERSASPPPSKRYREDISDPRSLPLAASRPTWAPLVVNPSPDYGDSNYGPIHLPPLRLHDSPRSPGDATYTSTPSPMPSEVARLEAIEGEDTYSASAQVSPETPRVIGLPALHENHSSDEGIGSVRIDFMSHRREPSSPTYTDKLYKCTLCTKSFTRNYDLTRHKSSHQDQRLHVCQHCGRAFNRRDALTRHNVIRGCGQNRGQQTPHHPAHHGRHGSSSGRYNKYPGAPMGAGPSTTGLSASIAYAQRA